MELNHWSHEHPLVLSEETADNIFSCSICSDQIGGLCYCCIDCPYVVHKWCAELPTDLTHHQLHPQHSLIRTPPFIVPENSNVMFDDSNNPICQLCKTEIYLGCAYSCDECSFDLHARCAVLQQRLVFEFLDSDSVLIQKVCSLTQKMTNWDDCFVCKEKLGHSCYISEDGEIMIHVQCATLPKTVKHKRHLHDLTLHVPIEKDLLYDECYCDACEKERDPKQWVYYCARCELAAHIGCGITTLDLPNQKILQSSTVYTYPRKKHHLPGHNIGSIIDCIGELEKEKVRRNERKLGSKEGFSTLEHFSHEHALTLYDEQWNGAYVCEACNINIYGKTYICNNCDFYLHKTCAELPREIQHNLHPEHPLTLFPSTNFVCSNCGVKNSGFSFSCKECDFRIHTSCALIPENLKHESHEHPLNVVIFTPHTLDLEPSNKFPLRTNQKPLCEACRFPCEGMSLECDKCGFSLHVVCSLYPPTGKAKTHRHGLVLNYSYQEDPRALEFFCDACEQPRTPHCWLYSCPDPNCYIVSHFDCAVPNLFPTSSFKLITKDLGSGLELV